MKNCKRQTETEWLPVLDFRNKSLAKGSARSTFDINKAQKRCFVKAAALHGLGLYIYNGEEFPSANDNDITELKTYQPVCNFISRKGKDATLNKTMRWLGIQNINKVTKKDIANAHKN
ncbi:Sak-like ssDNA annealing protein [Staphylococcus phage S-CoN_Ph26]|nr:Sak-like ssDNA annealing protein [Staphylococcus phage S-CoN_Ph26]